MSSLNPGKLLYALTELGDCMTSGHYFQDIVQTAQQQNAWYTPTEVQRALNALGKMLNQNDLETWIQTVVFPSAPVKVGLILAGNIPLVGFHDIISVLASGNIAVIKMSSADNKLIPAVLNRLVEIEPTLADHIHYVERLVDFNAVIATGSNNSSRYFDYYFGRVPHIIRKNRNSVAVLTGNESTADMERLGNDIFNYYGLGCRNVSKLYLPQDYDVARLFEPLEKHRAVIDHFKYHNNYDYNKSIFLVNGNHHFDNGFLLLKEDSALASPLAVLHYETYNSLQELRSQLSELNDVVQCIVSSSDLKLEKKHIAFGDSQNPRLWDYADDIDVLAFLTNLKA